MVWILALNFNLVKQIEIFGNCDLFYVVWNFRKVMINNTMKQKAAPA
jgi:hypothetical protein